MTGRPDAACVDNMFLFPFTPCIKLKIKYIYMYPFSPCSRSMEALLPEGRGHLNILTVPEESNPPAATTISS